MFDKIKIKTLVAGQFLKDGWSRNREITLYGLKNTCQNFQPIALHFKIYFLYTNICFHNQHTEMYTSLK